MGVKGSVINPYRFYGDKRAFNRKLTGTGRLYRTVNRAAELNNAVKGNPSLANPTVKSESTQCERISCRAPHRLSVKGRLARRIGITLRKLIKEFW